MFGTKARISGHYGVVPRNAGGLLSILSTKIFLHPVELTIWNRLKLNPVDFGLVGTFNTANKTIREQSEVRYPNEFWWRNSSQLEGAIQPSFTYEFPKDCFLYSMTGFVEINVNQSYIRQSLRDDEVIRFRNAIKIGMGTRIVF